MMSLLMRRDILTEDESRFYCAQTMMAVESIHKCAHIRTQSIPRPIHVPTRPKLGLYYSDLKTSLASTALGRSCLRVHPQVRSLFLWAYSNKLYPHPTMPYPRSIHALSTPYHALLLYIFVSEAVESIHTRTLFQAFFRLPHSNLIHALSAPWHALSTPYARLGTPCARPSTLHYSERGLGVDQQERAPANGILPPFSPYRTHAHSIHTPFLSHTIHTPFTLHALSIHTPCTPCPFTPRPYPIHAPVFRVKRSSASTST